jgi:hypothetical protein
VAQPAGVGDPLSAQVAQISTLAVAHEPRAVGRHAPRRAARHLVGTGCIDEGGELVEAGFGLLVGDTGKGDADEDDALAEGALDQRGAERF